MDVLTALQGDIVLHSDVVFISRKMRVINHSKESGTPIPKICPF